MPYVDGKYISRREWMERYGRLQTLSRVDGPPGSRPLPPVEEPPAPAKRTSKSASKAAAKATGAHIDPLPPNIQPVPGGTPVTPSEADTVSAHINDSDPVEVDDNGIPLA